MPLWNDAPQALRQAVEGYEDARASQAAARSGTPAAGSAGRAATDRAMAIEEALASARARDALTLWHLLARADAAERGELYDSLARLAPPPRGVTREGILRGDREQLDDWWNALGLGSTSWWRLWRAPLR